MTARLRCMPLLTALCMGTSGCAGPVSAGTVQRQIIIGFTTPTDTAAPATLAELHAAARVEVGFVAAVSPHSAAYRLHCPASDPDCERAIAALRALPTVHYLEPDRLKDSR